MNNFTASNGIVVSKKENHLTFWKPKRCRPSCFLTREMVEALIEYLHTMEVNMEPIDRKFRISAFNPCHKGDSHTEADSFLFLARDKFAPAALEGYIKAMRDSGEVEDAQIASAELLLESVKTWQSENGLRIPDVDEGCEMDACLKPSRKPS